MLVVKVYMCVHVCVHMWTDEEGSQREVLGANSSGTACLGC